MIILIGFPKSGTTSFHVLFKQLDYRSIHWSCKEGIIGSIVKNNKLRGAPLLQGLEGYDCITELSVCVSHNDCYWPQLVDYKQLYRENRGAVFILNKRDPAKLLASFKRWNRYDQRMYTFNPELVQDKTDAGFVRFVEKHYADVEAFFGAKVGARFIAYDIERDTIDKLKPHIDTKGVAVFPTENVNPKGLAP